MWIMALLYFKKNWKKCSMVSLALGYGFVILKTHNEEQKHMRKVCFEASKYAEITDKNHPRRVLVVLNPVANRSNSEVHLNKYCEPILHSAGFCIETMKTLHVGHAKTYFENTTSMPDAVIVAGGDGTASEVVTGIMRSKKKPCPIVILPMGSKSHMSLDHLSYIKSLTNSILRILTGTLQSETVIKYELIKQDNQNFTHSKPIYGLKSLKWGVLRDIDAIKEKYWYFGHLKYYAAIICNAFSEDMSWICSANLIYTPSCGGCNNCSQNVNLPLQKLKWVNAWHNKNVNLRNIVNENCGQIHQCSVQTSNLSITSQCNETENLCELITKSYRIVYPGFDFLDSFSKSYYVNEEPSSLIHSRTIQVIPTTTCNSKHFSIDGEEYEVNSIKVTIVPNAIHVFK